MFSSSDVVLEFQRKGVTGGAAPARRLPVDFLSADHSACPSRCGAQCKKQVGSQEQLLTQLENIHVESVQMGANDVATVKPLHR